MMFPMATLEGLVRRLFLNSTTAIMNATAASNVDHGDFDFPFDFDHDFDTFNATTNATSFNCDSQLRDNFLAEPFAPIGPRISGTISAISSATIIYLIFKSESKLYSIYHRIMFGMSAADIIGSTAMALTTIPMPKDLSMYDFHEFAEACWVGLRLGNIQTCEAQAFFIVWGSVTMYAYNAMLCVYYACAIGLRMTEDAIKKKAEPYLHAIPVVYAFGMALPPLVKHQYNPIGSDAWCTIADDNGRGAVTEEQSQSFLIYMSIAFGVTMAILFISIVTSFVLIILKVREVDRLMYHHTNYNFDDRGGSSDDIRDSPSISNSPSSNIDTSNNHNITYNHNSNSGAGIRRRGGTFDQLKESHTNTKILVVQMLGYILALLITISTATARVADLNGPSYVIIIQGILMPLQGFFNAIIFISHKVYNYHRVHPDVKIRIIISKLFSGCANDDLLFSRISAITINEDEQNRANVNVQVSDENKSKNYSIRFQCSKDSKSGSGNGSGNSGQGPCSRDENALSEFFSNSSNNTFNRSNPRQQRHVYDDTHSSNVSEGTGTHSTTSQHQINVSTKSSLPDVDEEDVELSTTSFYSRISQGLSLASRSTARSILGMKSTKEDKFDDNSIPVVNGNDDDMSEEV